MKTNTSKAEAKVLSYSFNPETGWYFQTSAPPGFTKIPAELRVEETQRRDIIGAATIIRSRQVGGRYPFFTGLRQTEFSGLYYGDFFERRPNGDKVNSFILFHFAEGNQRLTIHFFNAFKLYPSRRATFIADYWRAVRGQ